MMKSFADLLYELADFLREEGRRLESGYGLNGLNETYRVKAEEIHQALRTPNGDVLTPEQLSRITKKYDRTGTFFADIYALADSHEAMRRALDTADSVAQRLADSWKAFFPGMLAGARWIHEPCWAKPRHPDTDHWLVEEMTANQISWFKAGREAVRGQMIDIDHHEQDATEIDDNIHITGRED